MSLDPNDPIGTQRNFNYLPSIVEDGMDHETTADKSWMRRSRRRSEGLPGKIWAGLIPIAALGAVSAICEGVKAILSIPPLIW